MSGFAQSFKDLDVWKLAIQIAKTTYALTEGLPASEQYGLRSQMRRAAVSLSANIAEGFRRGHQKEFKHFLHVALGSAAELETCCELCRELFDVGETNIVKLLGQLDQFQRMTTSLITKLRAVK